MFHNNHGCEKIFGERESLEYSLGQIHKALITPDKRQINTVGFYSTDVLLQKTHKFGNWTRRSKLLGVPSAQCYLFDPLVAMLPSVCLDRSHGKELKEQTETKKELGAVTVEVQTLDKKWVKVKDGVTFNTVGAEQCCCHDGVGSPGASVLVWASVSAVNCSLKSHLFLI